MEVSNWLSSGFLFGETYELRSLLYKHEDWQIYSTSARENLLVVKETLLEQWVAYLLIERDVFTPLELDGQRIFCLTGGLGNRLEPVAANNKPETKEDALSFSIALNESRKYLSEVSFDDAIFVERFTRLLPTWSEQTGVSDENVLGRWLSGGVNVSAVSFRRVHALCSWLPTRDLMEVVTLAGFEVPPDAAHFDKLTGTTTSTAGSQKSDGVDFRPSEGPERISGSLDHQDKETLKLPGRQELEDFFNEHVVDIIFNSERYQALGIQFPSAIILHGPPGCGKTFAVDRLVEFIGWPEYSINSNSVGSPYIHETSKKISEVFDQALDNAPCVLIIDEMEAFLTDRRSGSSSGLHHVEEVSEFLRRIPEAINNRVLIIAMTNMIDMIDPAILRRGRFDHIIKVDMPSTSEVRSLLYSLLESVPLADNIDVEATVSALTGKPLSDVSFMVREAARIAARNKLSHIDQDSMDAAIARLPG